MEREIVREATYARHYFFGRSPARSAEFRRSGAWTRRGRAGDQGFRHVRFGSQVLSRQRKGRNLWVSPWPTDRSLPATSLAARSWRSDRACPRRWLASCMRAMQHHYLGCGTCPHCQTGWMQMCASGVKKVYGITAHGAHARYMSCPAETLVGLPDALSFKTGAAISCGYGNGLGGAAPFGAYGRPRHRHLWPRVRSDFPPPSWRWRWGRW